MKYAVRDRSTMRQWVSGYLDVWTDTTVSFFPVIAVGTEYLITRREVLTDYFTQLALFPNPLTITIFIKIPIVVDMIQLEK
jgi:hypothetical protein